MAFTVGLYYPWIDIRDEGWLKTAWAGDSPRAGREDTTAY